MWPFKALLKTVFLEFHSLNSSKLVPFVNLYDLSLCGLSRPSTVSLEVNQPILLLPNLPLDIFIWLPSSNHLVLGYRLLTVNELILSRPLVICRWKKSLHPTRERVGKWIADEDKRLKVAVMLFGPKNWNKLAQFVPGRTQVQCRERYCGIVLTRSRCYLLDITVNSSYSGNRWVNSLDPSLNWGEWTEEEDSKLNAAIAEHGHCWAKVAASVPPRTDNQCRRYEGFEFLCMVKSVSLCQIFYIYFYCLHGLNLLR
jgi:hypothetical protein